MVAPPPASDIYLDTSVTAGAVLAGTRHSEAALAFCRQLAENGNRVFFSQILRLEFSEAIRRVAQRGELPGDTMREWELDRWDRSMRVRERWLSFGVEQLEALLAEFREVLELPFLLETWQASIDVMAKYGLRSLDAVHVATAMATGLSDLATIDRHLSRVADLRVWLVRDT